jgi:hypothetical protein
MIMRSAVAGIAIALVLVAALVAMAHYSHSAKQSADDGAPDPAQTAAGIKDGFIGDIKIGAWTLGCGPRQELPKARDHGRHAAGKSPRTSPGKAPPSEWKIPRCRVYLELSNPHGQDGNIRITFRRAGLRRVLSLFLRFPRNEVEVGDSATLRADKTDRIMAVRNCADAFCLTGESIGRGDSRSFLTAKTMSLAFKTRPSGKHIAVGIPTNGLDQATAAMVRIDR